MKKCKNRMNFIITVIVFLTAVLALITAILGFLETQKNKEAIEEIEIGAPCDVEVRIEGPEIGEHVPIQFDVSGTSTLDDRCRYVSVLLRDISAANTYWEVKDIVQTDISGRWAGRVMLRGIPIGNDVKIQARVSARPDAYRVNQILKFPPTIGAYSNLIKVRRVQ